MIDQKEIAECYQPLFDYMLNGHGITLLQEEMDEIIHLTDKVSENLNKVLLK